MNYQLRMEWKRYVHRRFAPERMLTIRSRHTATKKYHADLEDSTACQVYNNIPEDKQSKKAVGHDRKTKCLPVMESVYRHTIILLRGERARVEKKCGKLIGK